MSIITTNYIAGPACAVPVICQHMCHCMLGGCVLVRRQVVDMEKYWVFDAPADSWRFG